MGLEGSERNLGMARFHQLTIYQLARENLRDVARITSVQRGFGDLANQMRRAAISVVSNIGEGSSSGSDRQFARYLSIARASANELQAQLEISSDLGLIEPGHPLHDRCDRLGRSITRLIGYLSQEVGGG
jgi:four helix bundle protein